MRSVLFVLLAAVLQGPPHLPGLDFSKPLIDNDRVTVRDRAEAAGPGEVTTPTPRTIRIGVTPTREVSIELKDHPVAPLANRSGYPNAFPRPRVKKVFENDRVLVWDYTWNPGEPTPMHFHDKDVVVVYLQNGALKSTTPDGKSVVNEYAVGDVRFNARDRAHTEELVKGTQRAIITELK